MVDQEEITSAGMVASELAERIAPLFMESDVPHPHWDEVIERLRELLDICEERKGQPHEQYAAGAAEPASKAGLPDDQCDLKSKAGLV